ncbi:MAG: substrate-binding domain-containing protein [Planctomycetes bacterium]|nr:substrate-binding domain-containing protein [Planctomycetota bacterium]
MFVLTVVVSIFGAAVTSGCNHGADAPAGAGKKMRVAVIPKGTSHEFWKSVEKGARRADAELADLEIVWKGPVGEGDASQQIQIIESYIAESYDGICLAPLDARALELPVQKAIHQKIPVVIFDSGLANAEIPITSYVATNNYHGGEMAGEHLAKLIGDKGNIILMPYAIGSESTEQREKGFLDAIKKHANIHVLSSDKHGGPDEAKAIEVGENLISTFGDKIDAIFCSNESSTSGILTVLRRDQRGLAKKINLVGFDGSANIVKGMQDGIIKGVVLQDPVKMGYEAVMAIHAKATNKEVKKRVETGETLATPENMNDPRIHELLFPLESK